MYKKTFFKNLGNVAVFGLVVTLVCFVIYSLCGWFLLQKVGIEMSNPSCLNKGIPCMVNSVEVQNPQLIQMSTMQILLFTALLCSSDVVAAVSIVDYTQQPKLYSCIFGEGVFNDIVSIILFNTVIQLQKSSFTAATPFEIIGEFFMLGIVSLSIGLVFGFLTSFIFKHCRFLRVNPIIETFLLFGFSMVSYFVSDLTVIAGIEMSGIISLLTCGIVQSHYTYYNLSPQGKICATLTISFMGTAAEAGVYSYIGIALYSQIPSWWSWSLISLQFLIIIFGRILAVFGTFYLFRLCFKSRNINFRELCFITYAGMIRGAIAFALVLRIPVEGSESCSSTSPSECLLGQNYDVLVSTTLVLVMLTTLIFGTFMGKVQQLLVPSTKEDREEYEVHQRAMSSISR
jgi:NhaP-type Na+/H+ or K+/H+ antiporter